ncbi:MAG TPA: hypothetical protein PK950_01380 [Candidatus Paceibacterota bacterium]|nr:hypothetical protein [Candidatus Paceibacterota bacterium]
MANFKEILRSIKQQIKLFTISALTSVAALFILFVFSGDIAYYIALSLMVVSFVFLVWLGASINLSNMLRIKTNAFTRYWDESSQSVRSKRKMKNLLQEVTYAAILLVLRAFVSSKVFHLLGFNVSSSFEFQFAFFFIIEMATIALGYFSPALMTVLTNAFSKEQKPVRVGYPFDDEEMYD